MDAFGGELKTTRPVRRETTSDGERAKSVAILPHADYAVRRGLIEEAQIDGYIGGEAAWPAREKFAATVAGETASGVG